MKTPITKSLIDDFGRIWDDNSTELRREFHATNYRGDFAADAIRNLGFVGMANTGNSLHVTLRPAKLSGITFASLMYWLHDQEAERVLISFYTDKYHHNILASQTKASNWLCELRSLHHIDEKKIISIEQDIASLGEASPLTVALKVWNSSGGTLDKAFILSKLRSRLGGRLVIVEPKNNDLVMSQIGPGMHWPNESLVTPLEGASVLQHPDPLYGRWVHASYSNVLRSNEPRLDDVDALVTWPSIGESRRRYRRLILPFSEPSGKRLLVGVTSLDTQLDLRLKVA
jgi:hypothetical protein